LIYISGARLIGNGLHLGHFLGCFQHYCQNAQDGDKLFFIISNKYYDHNEELLKSILLDILSIKNAFNIDNLYVITDDALLGEHYSFLKFIFTKAKLCNLLTHLPNNKKLFENKNNSVDDFIFPIEQAATFYLFDADYAAYNIDNLRYVDYANILGKKLNATFNTKLIKPIKLITGRVNKLDGYNYLKMSRGNQNAIYINSSEAELMNMVKKLFNFKDFFNKFPEEYEKFKKTQTYFFPKDFVPIKYFEAFDANFDINKTLFDSRQYEDHVKNLFNLLNTFLEKFRIERLKLELSKIDMSSYLDLCLDEAKKIYSSRVQKLREYFQFKQDKAK